MYQRRAPRRYPAKLSFLLLAIVYISPLLISWTFPYSYGYPMSPMVVAIALTVIATCVGLTVTLLAANSPSITSHPATDAPCKPWVLGLAYVSLLFVFLEVTVFRRGSFSTDIGENRRAISELSTLGIVGVSLSGAAHFCMVCYSLRKSWGTLVRVIPFLGLSLIHLLHGNRQFFVFGVLLLLGRRLATGEIKRDLVNAKVVLTAAIIIAGLFTVQLARQTETRGQQDTYMGSVFALTRDSQSFVSKVYWLDTAAMTVYGYYGIQYNVLSAICNNEVRTDLPLSGSVPMLYRRIAPAMGWPGYVTLVDRMGTRLSAALGSYGSVWSTFIGSLYMELGWLAVIGYAAIGLAALAIALRIRSKSGHSNLPIACFAFAFFFFGIQYYVFAENFAMGFIVLALLPTSAVTISVGPSARIARGAPVPIPVTRRSHEPFA